jgi:hypothetical protein
MDLDMNMERYGEMDKEEQAENLRKALEAQKVERAHIRAAEKKGESSKKGKQVAEEDDNEGSKLAKRSRVGLKGNRWVACDA